MEKRTISETIIDLESAALEAWHDGNPSPYLELYSKDFTYFDPAHEKRIDGWDKIKELYENMRGKVKMDRFEMMNPVVQQTETMAVLTYNLLSYSGEAIWKENYRKTAILHGTSHVFSKYFLNFVHYTC